MDDSNGNVEIPRQQQTTKGGWHAAMFIIGE